MGRVCGSTSASLTLTCARNWSRNFWDPISSRFNRSFEICCSCCLNRLSKRRIELLRSLDELLEKAFVLISDQRHVHGSSKSYKNFCAKAYALRRCHAMWIANPNALKLLHILRLDKLVRKELTLLTYEAEFLPNSLIRKKSGTLLDTRSFPAQLTQNLTEILSITRTQIFFHHTGELSERRFRSAYSLPFEHDSKYVCYGPLEEMRVALTDEDITVLLLWGAAGLGKTSLVRQLASNLSTEYPPAVQVFYLQSGKKPPIDQLQRDLIWMLGNSVDGALDPDESDFDVDSNYHTLTRLVKTRLSLSHGTERKLLIILDDIWETEVLNKLVVESKHVTYIVTSRDPTVCSSARKLEMIHPDLHTSRKVLSKYMSGLDEEVDSQKEKVQLIQLVGFNPLYLSSIATFIKDCSQRREDDSTKNLVDATQYLNWLLSPNKPVNMQNDSDKSSEPTRSKLVRELVRLAERRPLSPLHVGIFPNEDLDHEQLWARDELKNWSILIQDLIGLLSPREESGAKDDVYKHAKSVLVKLIGDKELDDSSMAKLLLDQRSSRLACQALARIQMSRWFQEYRPIDIQEDRSFACRNLETMTALFQISQVPASEADAKKVLERILKLEDQDAIKYLADQLSQTDKENLETRKIIAHLLKGSYTLGGESYALKFNNQPTQADIRADVQSMGFLSFQQKFLQNRVLALYNICKRQSTAVLRLVFFHLEGMGQMLGIRLPFSEVSIDEDFAITVRVIGELSWKQYWKNEEQQTGFKPIVFEQSEGGPRTHFEQLQTDKEGLGYLRFRPRWITCVEQVFSGQSSMGIQDQKISEQSIDTSVPELNKLLEDDPVTKFDVKIIFNVHSFTESVLDSGDTCGGPTEFAAKNYRLQKQTTKFGNGVAVNSTRPEISPGVRAGSEGLPEVGLRDDPTRGPQRSGLSPEQGVGQQEVLHNDSSMAQDDIQLEINVCFVCDPVGTSRFVEANVRVDYGLKCNLDPLPQSKTSVRHECCQCHDIFYLSFGCEDNTATIEMDSRQIATEYNDVQSQAGPARSKSSGIVTDIGAGESFRCDSSNPTEQLSLDREDKRPQDWRTRGIDGINFQVLPTHFRDSFSYEVSSRHRHDPGEFLHLADLERDRSRNKMFGTVNLNAGAKWTLEDSENGEHTWVFEAAQTRRSYAMPGSGASRRVKPWGKWTPNFRTGKQSRPPDSKNRVSQQQCRKEFSIDYDFFTEMESVMAECQFERNGKNPEKMFPIWRVRSEILRSSVPISLIS